DRVPRLFPTSYTVSPFRCRPTSMPELDPLSLHDALPIAGKEVVIDVRGVVWERDGRRILDHVDWTVRQGEHWALLGRNGSGKTTLLSMITGYIWPMRGRVSVLAHRYGTVDLRELRRRIGWVSSALQERVHPREVAGNLVVSGLHAATGLFRPAAP